MPWISPQRKEAKSFQRRIGLEHLEGLFEGRCVSMVSTGSISYFTCHHMNSVLAHDWSRLARNDICDLCVKFIPSSLCQASTPAVLVHYIFQAFTTLLQFLTLDLRATRCCYRGLQNPGRFFFFTRSRSRKDHSTLSHTAVLNHHAL